MLNNLLLIKFTYKITLYITPFIIIDTFNYRSKFSFIFHAIVNEGKGLPEISEFVASLYRPKFTLSYNG